VLELQGHRGARGLWPENTLAAFGGALELGVSTLELDCGLTRDGVVVVTHDPEINPDLTRGADGGFLARTGPRIFDLSFRELESYDVGRL
jgi:glycerophosphoryl diester phosphodiesterase